MALFHAQFMLVTIRYERCQFDDSNLARAIKAYDHRIVNTRQALFIYFENKAIMKIMEFNFLFNFYRQMCSTASLKNTICLAACPAMNDLI